MQREMFPTDSPSKFDKSLMDAYSSIHEGARKGHAAGDSDVEKQASQLASDVRYKAKGKVKPGASKEQMVKVYMSVLEKKRGMKLDDHPQYTKEGMDPVGQEDGDVDNDGDKDKSDEYLLKRRGAIKKAIAKRREKSGKKVSEGYSSWRMDLNYFDEEGKK